MENIEINLSLPDFLKVLIISLINKVYIEENVNDIIKNTPNNKIFDNFQNKYDSNMLFNINESLSSDIIENNIINIWKVFIKYLKKIVPQLKTKKDNQLIHTE